MKDLLLLTAIITICNFLATLIIIVIISSGAETLLKIQELLKKEK